MVHFLKYLFSILIISFIFTGNVYSQLYLKFNKTYNGSAANSDDIGNDLVVDNSGNIIITGKCVSQNTGVDFITIKYSQNGDSIWSRTFNTGINNYDEAVSISADEADNYYVTGYSDFSPQQRKIITNKYNSAGTLIWSRIFNYRNDSTSIPSKIMFDKNGNLYVCGSTKDLNGYDALLIKYDPESGDTIRVRIFNNYYNRNDVINTMFIDNNQDIILGGYSSFSSGGSDYLLVKFSLSGDFLWNKYYRIPITLTNEIYAIDCDSENNIFVTGKSYNFSPGGPPAYIDTYASYSATIKYNASGDTLWKSIDGSEHYIEYGAYSLILDSIGNSYICGNKGRSIKTLKYNNSGTLVWKKTNDPPYPASFGKGVNVLKDAQGNIYSFGYLPVTNGNSDIFLLKYSPVTGNLLWSDAYGSSSNLNEIINKAVIDKFNNIYILGYTTNSSQSKDILLLKYNEDPVSINSELLSAENYYLSQNYPNPFNPVTKIEYGISSAIDGSVFVSLRIYNSSGKEVAVLVNENKKAGQYSITFDGSNLPSGVYFCKLITKDFSQTNRIALIK